jgi:hypothetical protein
MYVEHLLLISLHDVTYCWCTVRSGCGTDKPAAEFIGVEMLRRILVYQVT